MLVWDDLASDEKIKIYDRGVDIRNHNGIHELLVSYRSGDMHAPRIGNVEALQTETSTSWSASRRTRSRSTTGRRA